MINDETAMLIDTHCHLNDPAFDASLSEVIDRAEKSGVVSFVVPAYDRVSLSKTADLSARYEGKILPAYGFHPWYAGSGVNYDILLLYLRRKTTVAVGEIGLDFTPHETPPQNVQIEVFIRQLDYARALDLPVLIHCRKAHEAMYDILKPYHGGIRGIMHSFSGTLELMNRFLDLGLSISFSGSVTRDTAKKYHKNAQAVPMDQLLIETDAPSIATETTGASSVEPRHAQEVARKIAELRSISFEQVCEKTTDNARNLFRLP